MTLEDSMVGQWKTSFALIGGGAAILCYGITDIIPSNGLSALSQVNVSHYMINVVLLTVSTIMLSAGMTYALSGEQTS